MIENWKKDVQIEIYPFSLLALKIFYFFYSLRLRMSLSNLE